MSTVVLPVAAPPGGSRPRLAWISVFGTAQLATRSSAGCERTVPLTSTSTLGTVYDASPRIVVWNGSTSWQLRRSLISCRPPSMFAVGRAGVLDGRPVCVPNCSVRPCRRRAFSVKSTPCQYCVALRAEVRFERDVVLRAAIRGRLRHHRQRDRVAAAAGQPRILRGGDRELLVVRGPAKRVVGHLVPS